MQERIRAFRDIAAMLRTRAQGRGGQAHDALAKASIDIEKHADGMAAEQPPVDADRRETRARELHERMRKAKAWDAWPTASDERSYDDLSIYARQWWRTLVDVIGEIERERHPLRVLTVAEARALAEHIGIKLGLASSMVEGQPVEVATRAILGWFADRDPVWQAAVNAPVGDPAELPPSVLEAFQQYTPKPRGTVMLNGGVPVTDLARTHLRPEPTSPPANCWSCGCNMFETSEQVGGSRYWRCIHCKTSVAVAEHPRDHVEPEDGHAAQRGDLCQPGRHRGGCPHEIGDAPQHATPDEATALAYGTWDPDGGRPTAPDVLKAAAMPDPRRPKPGDRVRTAEKLTAMDRGAWTRPTWDARRPNAAGEVLGLELSIHQALVRHDDGTEAPYDESELQPEPARASTVAANECPVCADPLGYPEPCFIDHDAAEQEDEGAP